MSIVEARGPQRRFVDGISIGVLTRIFHRDLIDDVLRESGRAGHRIRLLPGRVVVYLVLALSLFHDDAYEEVMRKLVNGLQFLGNWGVKWRVPTSSALSQARARLGAEPMQMLFDQVATPIARPGTIGAWFGRWQVMAVDGVVLDAPDTTENREEFPKPGSGAAQAPFPQVRLVGLGECGTHAIVAAEFDAAKHATERVLLARLLDTDALGPDMLMLCDRGFYSYDLWQTATATGADLLWRIKDNEVTLPVLEVLPDGSFRSELLPREVKSKAGTAARRGYRYQVPDAARIPIRVVEYTIPDRNGKVEKFRLITTILDHTSASSVELAALYAQRWEFELTLDEIETHQMSSRMLRSKTPELVRQEIWAMLLVHYAVRSFMREAADDIENDPDRASFIRAIRVIRRQVVNQAGFSPLPTGDSDS